jgi:hypothetical protein
MQVPIPIKGRVDAPRPAAPLNVFLEHPLIWWGGLTVMDQIAVLVILFGLSILTGAVVITLWQQCRGLAKRGLDGHVHKLSG